MFFRRLCLLFAATTLCWRVSCAVREVPRAACFVRAGVLAIL